ncbi:MAG: guanylate kinase [Quinella sp. 3Q1]|nr:guanylate kinase [Quinella sp. 3Q1]MBR3051339.1 guanylate kinase [Selenomonadaceae bacterium]MBR6887365.1 guanylate kinase [Selenomonadaceae bacterium]
MRGLLIVISGASGTGKGTVCKKLLADLPKIAYSISATTRNPRPGEIDGKEYYFLSVAEFKSWISEEKFLEYAEVYGNFYGTPLNKIEERLSRGEDILLEIDVQGALNVKKKCPEGVYIFLLPPSLNELKNRIEGRGTENPESLARRLKNAVAEIKIGLEYDYVVVNDDINAAAEQIKAILTAERLKVARNTDKFEFEEDFK